MNQPIEGDSGKPEKTTPGALHIIRSLGLWVCRLAGSRESLGTKRPASATPGCWCQSEYQCSQKQRTTLLAILRPKRRDGHKTPPRTHPGCQNDNELFHFLRHSYFKYKTKVSWPTFRSIESLSLSRVWSYHPFFESTPNTNPPLNRGRFKPLLRSSQPCPCPLLRSVHPAY